MHKNIKKTYLNWWVVETKVQKEAQAIEQLKYQGFNAYCPMFRKESLTAHQIKIKKVPLFSRYVFIQANQLAQKIIHTIRSTYGVSKLLKIGEVPIQVPSQLIITLKATEAKQLNQIESHFKTGDKIKIKEGLYRGLEAVYKIDDGMERAIVLINILNKETPLFINKQQIQKI